MKRQTNQKTLELVWIAVLSALIVVLQMISALFPVGGVSITLTLVPVVIGAITLGKRGGAMLGLVFGAIVLINCITGIDKGGNILWLANPLCTALICFVKGAFAGFLPSLLYSLIKGEKEERDYIAVLFSAMLAPIVNTGIFVIGMLLFFMDVLKAWAGGESLVAYIILGLAGINFLVEFIINIALSPASMRAAQIFNKRIH